VIRGESPDLATVKEAPFESYVGFPEGVKDDEAPDVKSKVVAFPRAGSAGQLPAVESVLFMSVQRLELSYLM